MNIDFEQNKDGGVTYSNKRAIPQDYSRLNVTGDYPWKRIVLYLILGEADIKRCIAGFKKVMTHCLK